ncbi:unnamed protein product [Peniophora sp. CBMAI 1063]|nr:unnamed protein product [Peniophora sp. CBMAI 1063]
MNSASSSAYMDRVLSNHHRLREVHLSEHGGWRAILQRDTPQLEVLHITRILWQHQPEDLIETHLLTARSPKLRVLELHGVGISWSLPAPPALRRLSLLSYDMTNRGISLYDVMSFLQGVPMLESLDTYDALWGDSPIDHPVVSLPRLEFLAMDEVNGIPTAIWSHLRIPNTSYVELALDFLDLEGVYYAQLVAAIQNHLARPGCLRYTKISLGVEETSVVAMRFSLSVQSPPPDVSLMNDDTSGGYYPTYPSLKFISHTDGPHLEEPTVSLFPAEFVNMFVLDENVRMQSSTMIRMFQRLTAIVELKAVGTGSAGKLLLSFLAYPAGQDTEGDVYLPKLKMLLLKDVDFDSNVPDYAALPGIQRSATIWDLLQLALQRRITDGVPLETLAMDGCSIDNEALILSLFQYTEALVWKSPRYAHGWDDDHDEW